MKPSARGAADDSGTRSVEFSEGQMEALPVVDCWADYVIDLWTG